MAYPSDLRPRRRKQAVPTMQQMVKRRAASPGGFAKGGSPYRGNLPQAGGFRRIAAANAHPMRMSDPEAPAWWFGGDPNTNWRNLANGGRSPGSMPNLRAMNQMTPAMRRRRMAGGRGGLYNPGGGPTGARPGLGGDRGGGGKGGTDFFSPMNPPPTGTMPIPGDPFRTTMPIPGEEGVTPPVVPDVPPSDQLPLDALYEAAQRMHADQLAARLAQIGPMREQVMADRALQEARLGTNEGVEHRSLLESLAGRGAFGGGIQARDEGYLATDYLRQRQDLASQVAQALAGFSGQESEANLMYQQGMMEALLDLANRQALSEYAVTPQPDTGLGNELPPDLGLGGGGGGPKWQPSWEPTWQPSWRPGQGGGGGGRRGGGARGAPSSGSGGPRSGGRPNPNTRRRR